MSNIIPLYPTKFYSLGGYLGGYYEYVGVFESIEEVPKQPCLFVINGTLRRRRMYSIPGTNSKKRRKPKMTRDLSLEIIPEDNEPMVVAKTFLKDLGIGLDEFKNMYDNDSDMHNARRSIERGGRLSWDRFSDIVHRAGGRHILYVTNEPIKEENKRSK